MGWGSILAIYLLIWTVTLFTVLPFGVRTSEEAGEDKVKGQADSAPARPMLAKKLVWTTIISAVLMVGVWWLGEAGYLDFMPN
ncbi:DUF1467 family protein [Sphingosinicella microcystinivorans]|uniref:Secreted protein n=1 Tax=Sphingosinicella microcystinivorans TaxID=335406 RepID=A0AAD1D6N7_SPHMI|nr:DUF1467 family protein [Sphingosinicella microcystinivorans]RKS91911.1 putative secreted protein [Sphingosinicella microcystinivorans]BBE34897.1 hypothetical protein SmB9_25550 [Sphingosinicella microcystinivorans]